MKIRRYPSVIAAVSAVVVMMMVQGCQMLPEIFNEDMFLSAVGLETGAQNQGTPAVDDLVLVKFTNDTDGDLTIRIRVHRPSGIEGLGWNMIGGMTVGQILKDCKKDPPSLVRVKSLGEDERDDSEFAEQFTFPDAFVWINGIPTLVSSAPRPLKLGEDFNCGDTIEYIVRPTAGDQKKFEIIAAIYKTAPGDLISLGGE